MYVEDLSISYVYITFCDVFSVMKHQHWQKYATAGEDAGHGKSEMELLDAGERLLQLPRGTAEGNLAEQEIPGPESTP